MVNEVILMGALTRPPELKYWEKQNKMVAILKIEIATNGKEGTQPDLHEIVMFGDEAEDIAGKIDTGSLVLVKGKVKSKIKDKTRYSEIWAREIQVVK